MEIQALISMFAAAVLMTAIALLAIFIAGEQPPRYFLTQPTWQWTGSTTGSEIPLAVSDPDSYTIRFSGDRTFEATADCNAVTGTYVVLPAGRAGGSVNSLALVLDPDSPDRCGAESLSDLFLEQLGSARQYVISGPELTITLSPPGTMTFEAVIPTTSPSPGP